ncbi:MAG: ATP synthase F1 subunit gamma [Thermodesulfobacteriota bacterium]|nr:ATP synthase F1 subunit gamma [Thermodesulfobacteriota bacterium]
MASLKEVQSKISGVKKTKQITRAMNMVASSRLRGAQTAMEAFRPYADKFSEVLGSLAEKAGDDASSPLFVPHDAVKNIHIVLCTSDRGLCGGFNNKLTDRAYEAVKEMSGEGVEISFTCFGKKGLRWCKKNNLPVWDEYIGVVGAKFGFDVAFKSGQSFINSFLREACDEVYIIYSEFGGMSRQTPVLKKILPIPPIEKEETAAQQSTAEGAGYQAEHICEPSPDELLGEMLPRNIYIQIYKALLETSTSEHAARMTAMDNATKACNDMIDELTLVYNKARQAAITAELMDIVGGAEALRG